MILTFQVVVLEAGINHFTGFRYNFGGISVLLAGKGVRKAFITRNLPYKTRRDPVFTRPQPVICYDFTQNPVQAQSVDTPSVSHNLPCVTRNQAYSKTRFLAILSRCVFMCQN